MLRPRPTSGAATGSASSAFLVVCFVGVLGLLALVLGLNLARNAEPLPAWPEIRPEVERAIDAEIPTSADSSDLTEIHRGSARESIRRRIARGDALPAAEPDRATTLRRWVREATMRDMDIVLLDWREDVARHGAGQ